MSLVIKDEECTICLELITLVSTIGTIKNCHHYYHEDCILQWSSHSNSCPTCRKLFYKIDVSRYDKRDKIQKLISIRDKLLPNDAIDQIPQEYIIPTNYPATERENNHDSLDQITENYSSNNKLCSICSSSDYRSSLSRNLIYCNNCPSAFHLNCLGVNTYEETDDLTWCCPMCDNLQEIAAISTYQSGVASNRSRSSRGAGNTRPRANRIRTPRTVTSLLNSHITDVVFRNSSVPINIVPRVSNNLSVPLEHTPRENPKRRPGLIIHNENGELDDDFLYDATNYEDETNRQAENNRVYSPPIINGGVILRKELKEKQKLSKEEAQSWDVFDEARRCQSSTEGSNVVASIGENLAEPKARRRRKKLSELPQPDSELVEGTSAKLENFPQKQQEKTRISSLISQLRSSSQTRCRHDSKIPTNQEVSTNRDTTEVLLNPTETASVDSVALSDSETKSQRKKACLDKPTNVELSLEHKVEIQKHIRNNLRPLYRPGESNSSHSPTIRSEEIYIQINKSASRKIYAHILSLVAGETGQLKSSILVDYFNDDEAKLKSIVDKFVQDELRYYKW
ncbi:unnamed protein product [Debaryomyces fabryi]|nr:unnamed protein product [Debaryomyces fabryi]